MLSFSDLNATVAASKVCKCLPSRWERGAGYRMQRTTGGPSARSHLGGNTDKICKSVQRQLLSTALSSISMFATGKKQAGMHRLNCIFLHVAYLGEKHITHFTARVLFPHTHTLFANHKLLTNMGALHLGCRDVSLFENKTNKAK